ncbi:hypothetical protein [Natronorubrum sp. DTA7]|uniref:hypothetical protein n=1 Tax=Natronorubrum sp. DTA7 TaxID=3447016 RepID=UPI003F84AE8D
MVDINRRKLLKTSGSVAGLSAIPGAAAANGGNKDDTEDGLSINDRTIIEEDKSEAVVAVDITNTDESLTENGSPERKRFVAIVDKESGSVSMREVTSQQYDRASNTNRMSALSTEITPTADDDVVERSEAYSHKKEECDVYDDYNHTWAAITAEFTDEVGTLGWTTVSAALISLIGSSSITGGAAAVLVAAVTLAGGLAAIVTDTYELTFGASEWDQSLIIRDQAMYSARASTGYRKEYGELTTISATNGHPAR